MIGYIDCPSGISGDMTLGALIDLGVPVEDLNGIIQSMLPNVRIETETTERKWLRATFAKVIYPHEHVHRHLSDILTLIEQSTLNKKNKEQASDIFRLIAAAEAKVHGIGIDEVHFHEVGAADSIADVVGCVAGFDYLGITHLESSPIPTGTGTIKIAHGTVPIPAPATAELLTGIPLATSDVPFELTTPTGAAIVKYYVKRFAPLPSMTISKIGLGAGSRNLEQQANILRLFVGDLNSENQEANQSDASQNAETAWVLETNIDDMSGELVGHCVEQLWALSPPPLDVWTTPIQMKKQRSGITVSVLCRKEQISSVENLLFAETTTLGVRRYSVERKILKRETFELETPFGTITMKRAILPNNTEKTAPEYESAKCLAVKNNVSVREIFAAAEHALRVKPK